VIRPYTADCFLCKVRRETYERTEDLPFIRIQEVGSFALCKITTGQANIFASVTEQEIKYLAVCDTAAIYPALYEAGKTTGR